jgi:tRNA threonylcarbamoyl adenosine modification protein YeaZ
MLVLAIDTATPAITAGLVELPQWVDRQDPADAPPSAGPAPLTYLPLLAERVTVDARGHAERLAPQIHDLLEEASAAPGRTGRAVPDAVVCGTGPGPFTGLRVGMVTAAALGDGWGVPVYGVCSLDAVAAAAGPAGVAGPGGVAGPAGVPGPAGVAGPAGVPGPAGVAAPGGLLVATDARRREVYWAVYRRGARVGGPHVQRPAELAARLPELGVTAAAGAGAELYADILGLPLLDAPYPTVTGLVAAAAADLRAGRPQPLVPRYLRRPDAAEPRPPKLVTARPAGAP